MSPVRIPLYHSVTWGELLAYVQQHGGQVKSYGVDGGIQVRSLSRKAGSQDVAIPFPENVGFDTPIPHEKVVNICERLEIETMQLSRKVELLD